MEKYLTDTQIVELSECYGFEFLLIKTVLLIESSGSGFSMVDGRERIKIQFEPHWYQKYSGTWINNGVRPQREEWEAFKIAYKAQPDMACLSTSWGLAQIMGFNYKKAGYKKVSQMVDAFVESEKNQLEGMLRFIISNKTMCAALKAMDWRVFASLYNGPKYAKYQYHTKLANTYRELEKKYKPVA